MDDAELVALVSTVEVRTLAGTMTPRHSGVQPEFAVTLHRLVADRKPRAVLEVGMAQGVSSVAIMTALDNGRLTSIDPDETTRWQGVGVGELSRMGFADRHRLIEDYDYLALPMLLRAGERFDIAYIDGWHTVDYTLLDLFYIDKMLEVGGVVGVNDCGFAAVDAAVRMFLTHRDYVELPLNGPRYQLAFRGNGRVLPVGAGRLFGALPNSWRAFLTRLLKGRIVRGEDRYFEKRSAAEPNWDYFTFF